MNHPSHRFRVRFWFELVLSAFTTVLFVVTLFWRDWIEAFGWDPDHHNGSAEWFIVAGLFVLCSICGGVTRLEYRRTALAR